MRLSAATMVSSRMGRTAAAALWLAAWPAAPHPAAARAPESGAESELRLSLQRAGQGPDLEVIFRNDTARDLWIHLGDTIGDGHGGQRFLPFALRFEVRGPDGPPRSLRFFEMVNVGGRMDPYVVPLRSGSSYSLRIRLDQVGESGAIHPFFAQAAPVPHVTVIASWKGVVASNGEYRSDVPGWPHATLDPAATRETTLTSNPLVL